LNTLSLRVEAVEVEILGQVVVLVDSAQAPDLVLPRELTIQLLLVAAARAVEQPLKGQTVTIQFLAL
jgi:hypothetical protein